MGGGVALKMLTLAPDRVATLVLANSAGFGSELHPLLRLVATPVIGALAARYLSRATARLNERLIFADSSLATDDRISHAVKIARRPGTSDVLHETAQSLSSIRGVRRQWRDKLMADVSEHPRPTLIVWGDSDRILPASQINAAHRLIPHARLHLFQDVGHMPQIEVADKFAALTLDFLRSDVAA
jgi:pimeloyl-ACP methyl ester carboxylesterase